MLSVRLTSVAVVIASLFLAPVGSDAVAARSKNLTQVIHKEDVLPPNPQVITWDDSVTDLRGRLDQDFAFSCPSGGQIGTIWGADVYTDDSSICTAAVHMGLITARDGGTVTIRILPGEDSYTGINRNGVRSNSYERWRGSFVFLDPIGNPVLTEPVISQIGWGDTAIDFRGRLDQDFTFSCPSSGRVRTVWGADIYTDDSSICTAAVHLGLITARDGGVVTIRIRPGADSYAGLNRNGVRSSSYGSWDGSFVFLP